MKLQGGISGINARIPHPYRKCWFGRFSEDDCRGRTDRCHIVSQQTIKREWRKANLGRAAWSPAVKLQEVDLDTVLNDRRNIVRACRHHHSNADALNIDYEIPQSAREFAEEYDLPL